MRFGAYLAFIVVWVLLRLRAGGALGVGRRLPGHGRRARFRRRRGGARERRGGGAGGGAGRRPAQGLRPSRDAAAQRAVHAARRRPAVVRLVRLQRRQRAGRQRRPRRWRSPTRCSRRRRRWPRGRCIDLARGGRVTAIGAATAIVVGLVAVTPAAGYVGPAAALALGALGAVPSYFALIYRARTKLDDSLDVVAAHGIGGATGAVLTGVFADPAWSGGAERPARRQPRPGRRSSSTACSSSLAYSGGATFVHPEAGRAGDAAAHQRPRRRRRPRRRPSTAKRPTRRRRRHPGLAERRRARPAAEPTSSPRQNGGRL